MKGTNAVYFKDPITLITEVIFGLIILLGLFGWMDALIIAKWFHYTDIEDTGTDRVPDIPENRITISSEDEDNPNPSILKFNGDYINQRSPSIINIMIISVFNFGKYKDDVDPVIGDSNE